MAVWAATKMIKHVAAHAHIRMRMLATSNLLNLREKNINLFLGHTAFGNIETNSFAAYSKLSNSIYIISHSFIVGSPVIVFLPRKYKTSVFHFVGSKLFDIPTHRT